ncbi:hypothetical protein Tco_0322277 [Tanacetum coccineum]
MVRIYLAVMSSASSAVTYTSVLLPILASYQAGSSGELMRRYLTEGLHESSCTDTMDFPCSRTRMSVRPIVPTGTMILISARACEPVHQGYVAETEDGPVDYPMDGGDDRDDDDGDSSGDDTDDEDEDDEDEDEEEEHLAPADYASVVPTVESVSPPEGTEPVIPPPSTDISTTGARITVRLQDSISLPPEAEVERLLAMTTPSPSPPILLSPPSAEERLARCTAPPAHSSPPPMPSPLLPSPGCLTQNQTLRIASTQAFVDAVTAASPSPPLPPSLYIPPPVDHRDDVPESELPPRKRLCLSTLDSKYETEESSTARPTGGRGVDYGFVSTVDAEARRLGISEVGVTEIAELHKHDTQDLYTLLEDAQDGRTRISQRVAMDSQRVNLLMGDRMTLQETVWIVEEESGASVDQYYDSIAHRDQTDKLVEASMSSLDISSTTISDLYKRLNVITQLLKDISNVIKDDPATN